MLAQPFVGRGYHRDLRDTGDPHEEFLHLGCAHVLAAPDDDVLLAIGDEKEAVVVEDTDVTGVVPAFGVDRFGGQLLVGVAGEQVGPAREDLASSASRSSTPGSGRPRCKGALRGNSCSNRSGRVLGRSVGPHERDPEAVARSQPRRGSVSRPARWRSAPGVSPNPAHEQRVRKYVEPLPAVRSPSTMGRARRSAPTCR